MYCGSVSTAAEMVNTTDTPDLAFAITRFRSFCPLSAMTFPLVPCQATHVSSMFRMFPGSIPPTPASARFWKYLGKTFHIISVKMKLFFSFFWKISVKFLNCKKQKKIKELTCGIAPS